MTEYPEHDKFLAIKEESEAIGLFLDHGLPKLGMYLMERQEFECECLRCRQGRSDGTEFQHMNEVVRVENGTVWLEHYIPTNKPINRILAIYFNIDLNKLEDEKRAMLAAI